MKIYHFRTLNSEAKAIVLPILQTVNLSEDLHQIAEKYDINLTFLQQDFKAEPKEVQTFYTSKNQKIILLGFGKKPDSSEVIRIFRTLIHQYQTKLPNELSIDLTQLPESWIEWATNGCLLGTYNIKLYKTEKKTPVALLSEEGVLNIISDSDSIEKLLAKGKATAETQMQIFDLMNAPANKKSPLTLAKWAMASGEKYKYSVNVLEKQQLKSQKLEALLAVGQGSDHAPMLIVMEYRSPKATKTIGLVGKGVTFDTGGISIKSSSNMHLMKSDMGGAAAVFGAIELAAKLELPVHLVGIVPACENSVDGKSFKPSDVIGSYSGKTIEIIDTDAEGRLILADGLSYLVKNFKVDAIVDLATLTGSCISTFGYHAAGLFSNNDALAQVLSEVADQTGERLWRLPLWDVYKEDLSSDIADVRNYSGKPMAGAITAAKFLEVFIENHQQWAHLDIAGTAYGDAEFAPQRAGTAFGIRLLVEFFGKYS